jgi:hypothetical protein
MAMENVNFFSSEIDNPAHNEKKKSRDSFHQALINFSFSKFIFSDFFHNKFLKFLMENYLTMLEPHLIKFTFQIALYLNIIHIKCVTRQLLVSELFKY